MDEVMKMLENGQIPSVMQVMQALNDISDYWPGTDSRPQEGAGAHKPSVTEDLYPPQRCVGCG